MEAPLRHHIELGLAVQPVSPAQIADNGREPSDLAFTLAALALSLRAEAQAGHYATIFFFIRTKRGQPTKGGRGSPLPFYLIYSKSGL